MTVEQFKEKYDALQKEGNDIYAQMKPLLKRLKKLSNEAEKLESKVDLNRKLYKQVDDPTNPGNKMLVEDGWNFWVYHRLDDLSDIVGDVDAIDFVLYNLKHTKFWKKGHQKMIKVHVATGPNSSATISVPEEVVKNLPSMDM